MDLVKNNDYALKADEFKKRLDAYREHKSEAAGRKLGEAFGLLVTNVCKFMNSADLKKFATRQVRLKCVYACFESVPKYDTKKGSAFNYFCCIVLNQMRKHYREYKNACERKDKYGLFVYGVVE